MMKVRKNLVSPSKYNIKCPNPMKPKYITVHNTANDASANNEIAYMISNNNQVSYHFAVDDKEIVQGLPLSRNGWHCGDGNGPGNRQSVGVEICYSKSGGNRYRKAEQNAIKFIAQLLHERNWGIDRVKKHQDWNGKYCPHRILSEGRWNSFKQAIEQELNRLKGGNTVSDKPSKWAESVWDKQVKQGYFDGSNPQGPITREQGAALIERVVNNIKKYHILPLEKRIKELEQKVK